MPINTKLPETIPPHGGEVYHLARTLGLHSRDLLDFSANINPLGFPPAISEVIARTLGEIVHYPDRHCLELRQELAGLPPFGPGSDSGRQRLHGTPLLGGPGPGAPEGLNRGPGLQ